MKIEPVQDGWSFPTLMQLYRVGQVFEFSTWLPSEFRAAERDLSVSEKKGTGCVVEY